MRAFVVLKLMLAMHVYLSRVGAMLAVSFLVCGFVTLLLASELAAKDLDNVRNSTEVSQGEIRPYSLNRSYWQYKGKPTLLIGASATDHLFLANGVEVKDLEAHLDEIKRFGTNYVRNTMSQREDWPLVAYSKISNGKYDLYHFNDEYWNRFSDFLQWTRDREIIVQIELWDRFDFSQSVWEKSPWNPNNNVNYCASVSGLSKRYPSHPAKDLQPFFHGVPGHPDYDSADIFRKSKYDLVRNFQEAFITKILSYTFEFDHVLYVVNNETSTHYSWGKYWIELINKKASNIGKKVYCTDMFNDLWDPKKSDALRQQIVNKDIYTFIEMSQANSRSWGNGVREHSEFHWQRGKWIMDQVVSNPRPMNNVKVYDTGYFSVPSGPAMGHSKMALNLIMGAASSRMHRSGDSNNLLPEAFKNSVLALRMAESRVAFWDIEARMDLLTARSTGEAFLAASPGEKYLMFFPSGGSVNLDLQEYNGKSFSLEWVSLSTANWGPKSILDGGTSVRINTPDHDSWIAILKGI